RSHLRDKSTDALGRGWSGQHAVDRDAGADECLGEPARHSELSGLGHAVVNHLGRNLKTRLARNKNDPTPVARSHPAHIVTRESNSAEYVGFEEADPVFIRN